MRYYSDEAIKAPLPQCTLYEYLKENNKDNLDNIALNFLGSKITYRKMFEEIDFFARAFIGIGIRKGDVVTVVSISCVNSVVIFYALNRIGAISNYINVLASVDEYERYFREAESKYIITLDLFAEKVSEAMNRIENGKVIVFSLKDYMPAVARAIYCLKQSKAKYTFVDKTNIITWHELRKYSDKILDLPKLGNGNEVSIYAHTSGTTGFPKTVLQTDYAYNAVAQQYKLCMEHKCGETFLNIIVPFVIYGMLTCLHMPLCLGLQVVLIPKFEASEWKDYIRKYRPNHIAGIPSYFLPMLTDAKLKKIDMSCVKTFAAGGDGINIQAETDINGFLRKHKSKASLITGYGMTEVCSSAVTTFNNYKKVGSVGIPLVKNSICIWNNDSDIECKYGEVGEARLYSPSLMHAYKNSEKETNNIIVTDRENRKWIKTGDLAYIDKDGFVFIIGRLKRFIFVGPEGLAYKVLPKIIEDTISSADEVHEVCVVSAHNGDGYAPKAYIVLKDVDKNSKVEITEKLNALCMQKLPDYLRPFKFEYLNSLPKTNIGKIDYNKIEKMENKGRVKK